jgi:hypothetical protein
MSKHGAAQVAMPFEAFDAAPTVTWNHVDGPLLCWAGQLHWLTFRERLSLWLGLTTIEAITQKRWPQRKSFAPPPPDIAEAP